MGHKLAGFAIIVATLVGVLVSTAILASPGAGVAAKTAPPKPPAQGSCGVLVRAKFSPQVCADLHTAEVVDSWRPGDAQATQPSFGSCTEAAQQYVGSPPAQDANAHREGQWSLPVRYRPLVISGPDETSIPDWSWRLCLVVPIGPAPWNGYTGSIRSMAASGTRSAALRPCMADNAPDLLIVGCNTPHTGEVVATQRIPQQEGSASAATDSIRQASCEAAAAELTGSTDPTYAGALRVDMLPQPGTQWMAPLSADTGVFYTSDGQSDWLICVLESAGDSRLVDSVAGVGAGPLPLE